MSLAISENVRLENTLGVPSAAEYYCEATDVETVIAAIKWSRQQGCNFSVLSGGSNVILEELISGLVIRPLIRDIVVDHQGDDVVVFFGAGENWHGAVQFVVSLGYSGIENLALIPGLCGAAPLQNIGAYGVELSDVLISVDAVDTHTLKKVVLEKDVCGFGYRDSIFKSSERGRYIITGVTLRLTTLPQGRIEYPVLRKLFPDASLATPKAIFDAVVNIRQQKLPDPNDIPNAGSFFKNPVIDISQYESLIAHYPGVPSYVVDDTSKKIPAAWLIEQAGWKGRSYQGVQVHAQHALVLTNPRGKPSSLILSAAAQIQNDVREKFQVELEIEPQRFG